MDLCLQIPNQEGWLFRMLPGNAHKKPDAANVKSQLLKSWQEYKKPIDAQTLDNKFEFDDLLRVAKIDPELKKLLSIIGLFEQ